MPDVPEATDPTVDQKLVTNERLDELQTVPPDSDDIEAAVSTVPLEDEDGNEVIIAQQNMGVEGSLGGGEFPSKSVPPRGPAPGTAAHEDPSYGTDTDNALAAEDDDD